jgi:spore coat protein U-like protein
MNHLHVLRRAAAAGALLLAASGAFADSVNMTVSASVPAGCRMTSVPAMSFGTLDLVTAADVSVPVTVSFKCTVGTTATSFSVGGSTTSPFAGSLSSGGDSISYSIGWTAPTFVAGTGVGSGGTATNVVLTGTMLGTAYANKPVGSYSQTVAIAINP